MVRQKRSSSPNISKTFVLRVRLITLLCVVVALVIIGRLYYMQIIDGEVYVARANAQYVEPASSLLERNVIYFSTKDNDLLTAATIRKDENKGERKRFYPGGSLAAHALGFVAYNNDDIQMGRYGLERYWEQSLSKRDPGLYRNFFAELFGSAKAAFGSETQTGDIITTLEPSVQTELERTLKDYNKQWNPEFSGGIIMDPHTGEIVGMAVSPSFDPNTFYAEEDIGIFSNPLVEGVYEMGSIMKPLTVAAGIDSGAISPSTTYYDEGTIILDGKPISNFDGEARGTVSIQEILSQSLNVGAAFVAERIGPQTMREYFLERYKFGDETGIDLPGEAHGLVENLESPRRVEYATAAFGQGIAITPIATVRALAVLSNGGTLVTPHLVRAIREEDGKVRTLSWGREEGVLNQNTTFEVSRMLTKVVDEVLVQGAHKLERHSVAAKTGTAQVANPSGGRLL